MSSPLDAFVDEIADQIIDRIRPALIAAAEARTLPVLAVTLAEAAEALNVHPDTISKLVKDGRLDVLDDVGRATRITVASLHAYAGHPLLPQLHAVGVA